MGNFAQQSLPLSDSVVLKIQRNGSKTTDTITVRPFRKSDLSFSLNFQIPYRSRFMGAHNFTDTASFLANNCRAVPGTNGFDINDLSTASIDPTEKPVAKFQQQPTLSPSDARSHHVDVLLDSLPLTDVVLPPTLTPGNPVNGSRGVAQFFMLDDGKTGALALGSFVDDDFNAFLTAMLQGLLTLKSLGATQLVVDVVSSLSSRCVFNYRGW